MTSTIHQGDVRDVLPTLDAGSVQCVVTSPPYWGLRDYGVKGQIGLEPTPEKYVTTMVEVFREVRRVLRDDGTLWLNLGDSFHNKQLTGIPWRVAFALQADGWFLRSDIIWHKPNPMPESVTDRPTNSHEYLFLLTTSPRYYYDADAVREKGKDWTKGGPGVGIKLTKHYGLGNSGNTGLKGIAERYKDGTQRSGRNLRSVWTINKKPYSEAHFATFPTALVEPCIKAGSTTGDLILDPFAGSGTVGCVALKLGRTFVGVELNPEYCTLARHAIDGPLFAQDTR